MSEAIRVSLIGEDFWCRNLEKQLNRENIKSMVLKKTPANPLKRMCWLPYFHRKIKNTDILHVISPAGMTKTLKVAKWYKTPVICHWIGSDVTKLNDPKKKARFLSSCPPDVVNLAVAKHLAEELDNHNICILEVVPFVTDNVLVRPEPLPEKPAVLLYWTDKRSLYFNSPQMFKLAESLPDISFYVISAKGKNEKAPPNVRFLGYVDDVKKYIRMCTVYIRWTPHDGQPVTVAESLAMGRYVILNHKAPCCEFADSFESARALLIDVLKRTQPNYEGAKFVNDTLNPQKNIEKLMSIYKRILATRD